MECGGGRLPVRLIYYEGLGEAWWVFVVTIAFILQPTVPYSDSIRNIPLQNQLAAACDFSMADSESKETSGGSGQQSGERDSGQSDAVVMEAQVAIKGKAEEMMQVISSGETARRRRLKMEKMDPGKK